MPQVDAIDVALNRLRSPQTHKHTMIPNNMTDLVRIAGEHQETIEQQANKRNLKPELLIEAARFYLQSLILDSGDDAYKTLGLKPGATMAEIKDHKRMMLKWLHPDVNKNRWQSQLFNRVQSAADRLQTRALTDSTAVEIATADHANTRKRKSKRVKASGAYQRQTGRRSLLMRSVGVPALAIAVGGAIIYLLNTQFHAGSFMHQTMQSVLGGKTP